MQDEILFEDATPSAEVLALSVKFPDFAFQEIDENRYRLTIADKDVPIWVEYWKVEGVQNGDDAWRYQFSHGTSKTEFRGPFSHPTEQGCWIMAKKYFVVNDYLPIPSDNGHLSSLTRRIVNQAQGFRDALHLTGLILTKMDGDARGGAAISIRSVTGVPIKFLGTGEKLDALESYDPGRLSSRILGMGDMIGLIEKAEAAFDQEGAEEQAAKLMSGDFTLEDWMQQMSQVRKMGPLGQIMDMLPGQMGQAARNIPPEEMEQQLKRTEAILNSMTAQERRNPDILNASRRRRIAAGSGNQVQDVNRLMKQFRETRKLFKTLQKSGGRGLSRLFG